MLFGALRGQDPAEGDRIEQRRQRKANALRGTMRASPSILKTVASIVERKQLSYKGEKLRHR
jgi:hypothetical protein